MFGATAAGLTDTGIDMNSELRLHCTDAEESSPIKVQNPLYALAPHRLDVIAWYLYLRSKVDSQDSPWDELLLHNVLRAKSLASKGTGFNDFYSIFLNDKDQTNDILASLLKPVYELDISKGVLKNRIVPPDIETAVALLYGFPVETSRLDSKNFAACGKTDLLEGGIQSIFLEHLIFEYIRLDQNVYAVCSFSADDDTMGDLLGILDRLSHVIWSCHLRLNNSGKKSFVRLLYAHESWWDERRIHSFTQRVAEDRGVAVVFIKDTQKRGPRWIKETIRNEMYALHAARISPHTPKVPHIHLTDTHTEAIWVAGSMLNENARAFLNSAPISFPPRFSHLIREYQIEMSARDNPYAFCLDTGAVMAMYGIRDCNDLDYIFIRPNNKPIVNPNFECHNSQYEGFPLSVDELVSNPRFHFIYKNIKALTLDHVLSFKKTRRSVKDVGDSLLIESCIVKARHDRIPLVVNRTKRISRLGRRLAGVACRIGRGARSRASLGMKHLSREDGPPGLRFAAGVCVKAYKAFQRTSVPRKIRSPLG